MASDERTDSPNSGNTPIPSMAPEKSDDFVPRYFEPTQTRLFRSPLGSARLEIKGEVCYPRIAVRRIRPLSDPEHYISLWADEDTEIGIVRDPADLEPDSLAILNEELDLRYFTPTIQRILNVKVRFGVHEWDVQTTRGRMEFSVRGLNQNVKQVPPARLLITDVRGNRYDIPNVADLDAESFDKIQRHM